MLEQDVLDQAHRDNAPFRNMIANVKASLSEIVAIRKFALARGWKYDEDLADWYHDKLTELEIMRGAFAELRIFAENRGWSEDDGVPAQNFMENICVDWEISIKNCESAQQRIDNLAVKYRINEDSQWEDKSSIEYLEALLSDLSDQYQISQPILRTKNKNERSCKNCHKEIYCGTRKDAWQLATFSSHIDNDDLLFSALADSCTVYSRKVDQ